MISQRSESQGFGEVVQPETDNFLTTKAPSQNCKCVPYYMCQPENSPTTTTTESRFFGKINVRSTSSMCPDMLDICCEPGKETNQGIVPPPLTLTKPQGCGYRNLNGIDFEMTGNLKNEAGFGEFPWTVALLSKTGSVCGGSLIHPSVVLTAAHCVFGISHSQLRIRAGEWDTQTTKERLKHQERNVRRIVIFPGFHNKSLSNDVVSRTCSIREKPSLDYFHSKALLLLERSLQLDQHINVICLPPQDYFSTNPSCFASGWEKMFLENKENTQ